MHAMGCPWVYTHVWGCRHGCKGCTCMHRGVHMGLHPWVQGGAHARDGVRCADETAERGEGCRCLCKGVPGGARGCKGVQSM